MRIHKLDGLRGIFSLMIVFFHYKSEFSTEVFYSNFIVRQSFIFVDYFFVLSGFVIALNYNSIGTWSETVNYMKKRIARLFPLLFFTTTFAYLYNAVRFTGSTMSYLQERFLEYLNPVLMLNSTPIIGTNSFNPPTWSISAEMIAYMVFGLICFLSLKNRKLWFALISIMALLGLWFVRQQDADSYGFLRGLLAFNFGCLVWVLYDAKFKIRWKFEWIIPLVIVLLLYLLNASSGNLKFWLQVSAVPVFAMSILLLINSRGSLSRILESKPMQLLGMLSFSIYLNHLIVVKVIPRFMFKYLEITPVNMYLVTIISIVVVLGYSFVTYKIVEKKGGLLLRQALKV
ncbi:MAG: acyltransferase [Bacteroidia bacterium]